MACTLALAQETRTGFKRQEARSNPRFERENRVHRKAWQKERKDACGEAAGRESVECGRLWDIEPAREKCSCVNGRKQRFAEALRANNLK